MKTNRQSFSLQADLLQTANDHPTHRILELSVQAPEARERKKRLPLNLALVLDRSGSMSGEKLDYARKAAHHVLDLLREGDRVALVIYSDEVQILQEGTPFNEDVHRRMKSAVDSITAGGMTNLSEGWLVGCQQVAAFEQEGYLRRVLLLTDGLANRGIMDIEQLSYHAGELHNRGISTSTFGLGMGFNEHLLEAMANQGGGNFFFIEHPQEIPGIFLRELADMLEVTARDVEVTLTLPSAVEKEVLGGWKSTEEGNRLRIHLGDLPASQRREVYIRLFIPAQNTSPAVRIPASIMAKNENNELLEAQDEIELKSISNETLLTQSPDKALMQRYALVYMADVVAAALKIARHRERNEAARLLEAALDSCAMYLNNEKLEEYRQMVHQFQRGVSEHEHKVLFARSYSEKQTRTRST